MKSKPLAKEMAKTSCAAAWQVLQRQNYNNNGRFNNQKNRNGKFIDLLKLRESKILFT